MADWNTGRVNKANTSTSAKTTYLQDAPLQRTYNNVESYDKN